MKNFYIFLFFCCLAIESYGQSTTCASATTLTPGALGAGCTTTTGTLGGFATTTRCSITTREGFYQFNATASNHTIIVDGNANVNIIVSVGTECATITDLANCVNASNIDNDVETIVLTGLTIGEDYFIAVRNANTAPNDNNNNNGFTICVTTPVAGDNCANAISLTPNVSCITTAGDNQAYANGTVGCGSRFRDGWFSFTATQANHNVTVDGASRFQAVVGVFTSCAATSSPTGGGCATATAEDGVITLNLSVLTIGVTYFIQVYNNSEYTNTNNNRHQYTICVTSPVAPPANDICSSPTVLTHQTAGNCTTTAGTVAGATQSLAGCTGTADDDVWYSFVATSATAEVRVTAGMDEVVQVFSGTCAGLTSLVCQDTPEGSVIVSGLTVGQTYLVRVYSWGSSVQTTPTFTICVTTPAVPANDNCAGAITLTHETFGNCTLTSATVANATQSLTGCTGTANDDVWFSFVATSSNAEVKVTWSEDEVVQIYSGTCGSLSSLVCQDTPEGSVAVGSLTIGNTYFVRVYDWFSTVSSSPSFTICVTTPAAVVNNDECSSAVTLTHQAAGGCTSQTFDINGKTESQTYCSGTPSPVRDAWFRFTATATSAIIHRVASFRSVIQVFNGGASPGACGGTSLDCYNPTEVWSGQQGDLEINGLTVGNVYFFRKRFKSIL